MRLLMSRHDGDEEVADTHYMSIPMISSNSRTNTAKKAAE